MRGRGGRGGRGRGRSITQDLVRDNLDDLGLQTSSGDDTNEPRKNYPHVSISTPVYPDGERVFLIEKSRDLVYRIERSYSNIPREAEEGHLQLGLEEGIYGGVQSMLGATIGNKRSVDLMHYIKEDNVDNSKYLPAELTEQAKVQRQSSSGSDAKRRKDINLGRLEQQEKIEKTVKTTETEAGSDADAGDGEDQDEDLDDDYGVDHYADSDAGDVSDDGHGEAVF